MFSFLKKQLKENKMISVVFISLMLIPLFQIGYSADFAMRASIPELVYLCIMVIRRISEDLPEKRGKCILWMNLLGKRKHFCV